jgi:hypothetical protein
LRVEKIKKEKSTNIEDHLHKRYTPIEYTLKNDKAKSIEKCERRERKCEE